MTEIVSKIEKEILNVDVPETPPLPYPTRKLKMFNGSTAIEYVIPDEDKEKVLKELYPYEDCPDINERRYDLHEEKNFAVRRFKVIREDGRNYLVSPYYARSGGMVIDWSLTDDIIRMISFVRMCQRDGKERNRA